MAQLDADTQLARAESTKVSAAKSAIGGIIGQLGAAAIGKWG